MFGVFERQIDKCSYTAWENIADIAKSRVVLGATEAKFSNVLTQMLYSRSVDNCVKV